MDLDRCQWKKVDSYEFTLGIEADRCGEVAAVKILRPYRKTDLYLCEEHLNKFIDVWSLHNQIELLCTNWIQGTRPSIKGYARAVPDPSEHYTDCMDPGCKTCLPDEPKTWRHKERERCFCGDFALFNGACGPNGCYNRPA